MIKLTLSITTAAVFTLLISSCYMRTPKLESWTNPEFKDHDIGKTVVLCTDGSETINRQYEDLFVQYLLPYVPAGPFHATQDIVGHIDQKKLEIILNENNIQTIIVTGLVDGSQKSQTIVTGYDASPYDGGYYGYYNWGYSLTANTATVNSYMEFVLETKVYDVESKKLIWTGRKSIYDDRSNTDNMNLVIGDVVKDLKKHGILK